MQTMYVTSAAKGQLVSCKTVRSVWDAVPSIIICVCCAGAQYICMHAMLIPTHICCAQHHDQSAQIPHSAQLLTE